MNKAAVSNVNNPVSAPRFVNKVKTFLYLAVLKSGEKYKQFYYKEKNICINAHILAY